MEQKNCEEKYFYTFLGKRIGLDGIYQYTLINEEKYKNLKNNMNQMIDEKKGENNG
jgi:hypothetical protein